MKKNYILAFLLGLFFTNASAQFTMSDVKFWVGSGSDSSVFIVDFRDGSQDSSYAWGFLFNEADNLSAKDILPAIAAAEPKFTYDITDIGYLNDVIYNSHSGINSNPTWWSIWSGYDHATMERSGSGLNETLEPNHFYGVSYGWMPEPLRPAKPWAAFNSLWFDKSEVEYWVGTGLDSAVLVIDFVVNPDGDAKSFAYGVKFTGSITGKQMLQMVDASDPNLHVSIPQYLDDITYNHFSGLADNPYYWSTFSGTNMSDWVANEGVTAVITNGQWFGTAYGDWPTERPFTPIPANNPHAINIQNVVSWVGSGLDSAVIVIDFNDGQTPESFAFGYKFTAPSTGKDALIALENGLSEFDVDMGAYLNDITYKTHVGIGAANGNYWSTWSGLNNGNWTMNSGINTTLSNGHWFGLSYTDFSPALPPSTPASAPSNLSVFNNAADVFAVYPNPFTDVLNVHGGSGNLTISDITGKIVYTSRHDLNSKINLSFLENGMYLIAIESNGVISTKSLKK